MRRLLTISTTIVTAYPAYGTSESTYQDGNTLGLMLLRFINVLIEVFQTGVIGMMVFGFFLVMTGVILWAQASKLNISPWMGMWTALVGILLCSPIACSSMASNMILNAPAQVFSDYSSENYDTGSSDFISPNQ